MTDSSRFDGSHIESGSSKKTKKPMMEKLRRERINRNLNEMKVLVLEALHRDSSRYSKMEKADILEMTVKYLKQIHFEMKTRKDVAAPTEFNVVSSSYQASDALAREAVLRANQQAGPRPRFVQNFHDNSLSQQPKPIAPALPTTTSLLPATSVAMATRSNRTLRWVPYPSPPSSPTGSKMATSCTRLQHVANVCPPMVASPCIDNPSAIPISGVSFPSDRLLWRRW